MKKLFLISVLTVLAAACSNNAKTEAEEQRLRDSMDNMQVDANQRMVDSLEHVHDSMEKAQADHHDSGSHEGHDHSNHNH